jgi:hypothetical protein
MRNSEEMSQLLSETDLYKVKFVGGSHYVTATFWIISDLPLMTVHILTSIN